MSQIITVPFTEDFLPHVAGYIDRHYAQSGKDLSRLALVFGGRRPSLFLKRDLGRRWGKAFVPPCFFTMDEWMSYAAYAGQPSASGSDLDHCYRIYRLALAQCPQICQGREKFSQFLPWAREILRFIEHLDLEDIPAEALATLKEQAHIGFSVPEDINELLVNLGILRQAYHQQLEQLRLAPRGYQYLQASRRIKDLDLTGFDEILFCNFFYLHRTENIVLKNVYDRHRAVLFMQGDQRRWPALERMAKTFGTAVTEGEKVRETSFDLKLYEAFDQHSQAALIKDILADLPDHDSTVIVLPDPDFLLPLLTTVGQDLKEFNISMGYPLKRSALYALLELITAAQNRREEGMYYAKDYLQIIQHPLVKSLALTKDPGVMRVLAHKIEEALKGTLPTDVSGSVFLDISQVVADDKIFEGVVPSLQAMGIGLSLTEFKGILGQVHEVFFGNFEGLCTAGQVARALENFLAFMQTFSVMDKYPFNSQIALRVKDVCAELAVCSFASEPFESRDLFHILQEKLSSQMVAFTGSPLRGVQILGLFETRALNFKNVIIADVNEGYLPSLNMYEPLIPREVMISLNLDRLELEEEIQRYGFMRLISAAQRVRLVYQQKADRMASRFIEELVWEQEQRCKTIGTMPVVRPAFEASVLRRTKAVPKTPEIITFLENFKFSASSINVYLRNPYEFYCRYILGLRPQDNLLEDLENRHIGVFIHELFEQAFKGWVGKRPVLDEPFLVYFQKIYQSCFAAVFGKAGHKGLFLIETVLKTRLERFLKAEAQRCRKVEQVICVERKFEETLGLAGRNVRWTYRFDRVDQMSDGSVVVLDYKTGGFDPMPRNVPDNMPLTRENICSYVRSFQMPLYVHYLQRQFPKNHVNAAFYHLRTTELDFFLSPSQTKDVQVLMAPYLKALEAILAEIFNSEIPFADQPVEIK